MTATPDRAIILARISDARDDDTKGVDQQQKDGRQLAGRLGWTIGPKSTHVIVENDTSAYKRKMITLPDGSTGRRTVRPEFRRAVALLASGQADGLIAYDLDRTVRDPRDLEDLIDVVEAGRIPVESVTGSLRLANDADITMARVMVAIANKSSRDTARRVSRARLRQAEEGLYGGGRRGYGYDQRGMTLIVPEAAEIRRAADAILAGASLRSVLADLRARDVPTVTGVTWSARTLRDMLIRPRNAGLAVHRGEIVGPGGWPAILDEDEWRALRAHLTAPGRRTSPGNRPRWLGSKIYLCGVCGNGETMVMGRGSGRPDPSYHCGGQHVHLRRKAAPVDAMVEGHIVTCLSRPDSVSMLRPAAAGIDTAALHVEASALHGKLDSLAALLDDGVLTERSVRERSALHKTRLAEIDAGLAAASADDPLRDIAGQPDAAEIWDGLTLGRQRAILREILAVTVLPARKGRQPGGTYFDLESVRITQIR